MKTEFLQKLAELGFAKKYVSLSKFTGIVDKKALSVYMVTPPEWFAGPEAAEDLEKIKAA